MEPPVSEPSAAGAKPAATQAAAAGVSVQTIQNMYGHESIQTTMRYVTALNKEKKEAINIMDKLF